MPGDAFKDSSGNPNPPAKLSFTTAPPVEIVSASPKHNEADVPVNQPITVRFSRQVAQSDAYDGITLKTEGSTVAITKTLSGDTLTVRPSSPLTYNKTYMLTIPAGAVKDPTTGAPSVAFTLSFSSAVPPAVKETNPANNATGVYRDQPIVLTFSEPIKQGTAFSGITVKADSTSLSCNVAIEAHNLILTPQNPLPANTKITVTAPAGAVTDLKGTPFQSSYSFSFTTGTGGIPPQVAWTSPADGETSVSLNPNPPVIYVRFSKNVQPGPNWNGISLSTEAGQTVQVTVLISYGSQLELRPTQQLSKNTWYKVTLPASCVKETLGTPLPNSYTFRFRTQYRSGPYQSQ